MNPAHYVLDTVEKTEVLVTPEALAGACARPVEDRHGRKAVRLELPEAGSLTVALPLPRTDLTDLDQLSLQVSTRPSETVEPGLRLTLSSRTEGLPRADYFNSGHAEPVSGEAWREVLYPFENYLIYGTPPGVKGVERAELSLAGTPGTVWIGELRGARRKRARGPRLTDEGLLAELDLGRPELAGARAAAEGGRTEDALRGFLKYLRERSEPRHPYGRTMEEPKVDLGEADAICSNFILGYHVGTPIDWRLNPNGYLEWMHAFNRSFFFRTLLNAWRKSADPKYVRKLDELFASWIAANPEPVDHNGGGDPAWETLSTACRIYGSWLECFFALMDDANFSDLSRIAMLKSFHGHAEHLMKYKGYANNWLVVESRVLAVLGMLFPEFRRAEAWAAEGFARLDREIERQIFPDGADWEFAPGYHMMAARGFLDACELARLNGRPLAKIFDERLPKTFDYIAGMSRPDGSLPSVNDSGGYNARNGDEFLRYGARLFERPELTASPEGPYAGRSRGFPDAGFHILAGGTGPAARWLLFDAGPLGAAHRHEDALSIELFAMGVPFVVDPGIASYLVDQWTSFYRHARAHSTVLVNGAGQDRMASARRVSGEAARSLTTESARASFCAAYGPVFDWARGEYGDGYEGQPAGLVHCRAVVFLREAYYVVIDEVTGAGAERMEALYHFSPMRVEAEAETRRVLSRRMRGANLEIVPLEPRHGLRLSIVCGQNDPVQGWVADGGEDLPAPVAVYSVKGQPPLRFAAALIPFASGVNAGVKVSRLPKMPPNVMGVKLAFADGHADRIFFRFDPAARLPAQGPPLDADVKVERLDAKGKVRSVAWAKGSDMTVQG